MQRSDAGGMSYLAQKIEAEKRMRDLLEASDLPQPDRVEYGFNCIRLFFEAARRVVVIDLEAPSEGGAGDVGAEQEA